MPARVETAKTIWRMNRPAAVATAVLLVIVLAAWGTSRLLLQPHARNLENQLAQRQRQVRQTAGGKFAGDAMAQERLRQAGGDVDAFWGRIPHRQAFPELLSELMNMAVEAGLAIERVTYRMDDKSQEGLLRYSLAFSVNADYGRVKKFVHLMERSSRLLILDQISLSGRSSGGGVRLNVGVSTIFRE